jgi:hypothetical protein
MARLSGKDSFWTSYSDLMTSLFFVMLVLFIICIVRVGSVNQELKGALEAAKQSESDANAKADELNRILQLDEQFKVLSKSSSLAYDEEKRMFYAPGFQGIEIFKPYNGQNLAEATVILDEYKDRVDKVGKDLQKILKDLHEKNKDFRYQLVIEGTAAIPYNEKKSGTYNADSPVMYELSYQRALALYNKWKDLHLRNYNTEIIIAGSGFNGINRDEVKEDNNKRFTIQIIPKITRPNLK